MKTEPLQAAHIVFDDPAHAGQAFAPHYGDAYHARLGAHAQACHVFLGGNGLPGRWQGRARFVILETGFGLGQNFLATWAAWRADPARCERLVFLSMEKHPVRRDDLARVLADSPEPTLAAELLAQWPPATPDLHTLNFDDGQVQLLLALGDVATWMPEWVAQVDAFYLDGFAPSRNLAMWDARLLRQCGRLGTPDATMATWTWARVVRDGLTAAGFVPERRPGFGTKRDMLVARRWQAPDGRRAHAPAPPPGRLPAITHRRPAGAHGHALVIGAGLAGAAVAWALARQGWQTTVLERRSFPAQETSGNPSGLFHGVLHAHDGAHAQLLRAAALRAEQVYRPWIEAGQLPGQIDGLLRAGPNEGEPAAGDAEAARLTAMQAVIDQQALPASYVSAVSAAQAEALSGLPASGPGWWYAGGGWLSPAVLVAHWLGTPGVGVRTDACVTRLRPEPDGGWQALDAEGHVLATADVAVLAGASDGLSLLDEWTDRADWPIGRRRGQVTWFSTDQAQALALPHPHHPVASGAYLTSLPGEGGTEPGLLCGATNTPAGFDDHDDRPRTADHLANLAQLDRLRGHRPTAEEQARREALAPALAGRVGWRLVCDDRLPLVGGVPLPAAALAGQRKLAQPRQVPRVPGLYVLTALGSRGITLAPLLGEVLAAGITGAPVPLAASLLDAIDPARFLARVARRSG